MRFFISLDFNAISPQFSWEIALFREKEVVSRSVFMKAPLRSFLESRKFPLRWDSEVIISSQFSCPIYHLIFQEYYRSCINLHFLRSVFKLPKMFGLRIIFEYNINWEKMNELDYRIRIYWGNSFNIPIVSAHFENLTQIFFFVIE